MLSEFTAALFEDSGWYKADYSALSALDQHALQWGKGMVWIIYFHIALLYLGLGCSFLNEQCINQTVFPYLCDENVNRVICTFDHLSKVWYVQVFYMMYLSVLRDDVLLLGVALMVVLLHLLMILLIIVDQNQLLEL